MKDVVIILGVICLQVAFGKFTEEDLRPIHRECIQELNLNAAILLANCHEDFTVTEGDSNFNKVIFCAFRKGNYLNVDDTLDYGKFHIFVSNSLMKMANISVDNPMEAATNAIDACKTVQGSDPGDALVKNYNCVVKYLRNL